MQSIASTCNTYTSSENYFPLIQFVLMFFQVVYNVGKF